MGKEPQARRATQLIPTVYVPSKGRPSGSTAKLLAESGINFLVVVEPQEYDAYKAVVGKRLLTLPASNQGIAYVRNWILQHHDSGWYWMLDDDITAFFKTTNGKNTKVSAREALEGAGGFFIEDASIGQAALEYQQFAWSATRAVKHNGYCDVAVCINKDRVKMLRYRPEVNLKEDRDFTLQVLSSGMRTARVCRYSFAAPKNGSNAGGLSGEYSQTGKELAASRLMCRLWPGICTPITKRDGRQDVKINWRHFSR